MRIWCFCGIPENENAEWKVEIKKGSSWRATWNAPSSTLVEAPAGGPIPAAAGKKALSCRIGAIEAHRVYRCALSGLKPGEEFTYRVTQNGKVVFEANAHARKTGNQPYRFVAFGDTAQDTPSESAVVYRTSLVKPDFVFIAGDIVYSSGRISEYRHHYFPVFNSDEASVATGAPLIRSIPMIAAPGNHDTGRPDFQRYPDAMAYFLYWDQPLNGPLGSLDTKNIPSVNKEDIGREQFLAGASNRFPRMANFSFDYGNSHWLVLDSNNYVDWTDAELRAWVKKDLESAKNATWRFVGFHHPGFNSAKVHFDDQWMRVLSDVFEEGKVDVVFAGHVHNYQRSFPLTFAPKAADGKLVAKNGERGSASSSSIKNFETELQRSPRAFIYVVTGGGGADLANPEMQKMLRGLAAIHQQVHLGGPLLHRGRHRRQEDEGEAGFLETGEEVDAWQIGRSDRPAHLAPDLRPSAQPHRRLRPNP